MKAVIICSSILLVILAFTVDNSFSVPRHRHKVHRDQLSPSSARNTAKNKAFHGSPSIVRGTILRRAHRQAAAAGEDSYEDVVEYEYEDEVSPTDSSTEVKEKRKDNEGPDRNLGNGEEGGNDKERSTAKPDPNGEGEDEYYDTYDEVPNNTGDEEEGESGRPEEEEENKVERRPPPTENEEDPDEDSSEREDRIEEERRQAEIREAERLEEERREEERREQLRKQEAAEEEEEEEEEATRRMEYEERQRVETEAEEDRRRMHERVRAEAEAAEEKRRAEERMRQTTAAPPPPPEEPVEEEVVEYEDETAEQQNQLQTAQPTFTTTFSPSPHPEEFEEYEVGVKVEEPSRRTDEFQEEGGHLVVSQHEGNEGQDEIKEMSREELEEIEEGPREDTESEERRLIDPIPIEESGREDLERYTTYDRKSETEEEEQVTQPEEDQDNLNRQDENVYGSIHHEKDTDRYNTVDNTAQGGGIEDEESEDSSRQHEFQTTQSPQEEVYEETEEEQDRRYYISTSTTTEQTPYYYYNPTVPAELGPTESQMVHLNENEINGSTEDDEEEEDQDKNYENPYSAWQTSTTQDPYPVELENQVDTNQVRTETIQTTESPAGSLGVDRTRHHGRQEDEDDDEHDGFYEGRRFNEENRRNNVIEEEEEEFTNAVDQTETHREIGPAANLDLSREPEEDTDDDVEDITTTTTTTRPVVAVSHFPSVNEIDRHPIHHTHHYPDSSENHISPIDDSKMTTSFSGNKLDESDQNQHQHPHRHHHHGSSNSGSTTTETFYNRFSSTHHQRRPQLPYNQYDRTNNIHDNIEEEDRHHQTNRIDEVPSKIECFSGYRLSDDGTECLDIDECLQNVCGPTQICRNTPGSYHCLCNDGYEKDFRNQLLCRDINECEVDNGGCSQDCVNIAGGYYCSCADEYQLSHDKRTCIAKPTTPSTSTTTTTQVPPTPSAPSTVVPTIPHSQVVSVITEDGTRISSCPTPPVPRGSGIAYLYCSRSPVGIHHRHSQLERRLLQDWAARKNRYNTSERVNSRFRLRRTLKRRRQRRQQRQTTYSPGSICELRCRSGYEITGQYTLHCNATTGLWEGTTEGFCQAIPKPGGRNVGPPSVEITVPSNEIPRLGPNEVTDLEASLYDKNRRPVKPHLRLPTDLGGTTSFRPNFYQLPTTTSRGVSGVTLPPPATRLDTNRYWTEGQHSKTSTTPLTTTTTLRPHYNYYSPVTPFNVVIPSFSTSTSTLAPQTTNRNSFIHLTYRFKTPWIKCPDDIKIDLQPGQRLAYVIIPQPQTNVDWWRQVTSEPAWAKGLETEIGPGKQKITYLARTPAPLNNTAECSLVLEVRDIEPPTIRDCPESFSVRLSPGKSARAVTWVEPHFSDNVRVATTKKSREPGTIMTAGEHVIHYEVGDSSNNRAKCTFTVHVLPAPVSSDSRFNNNINLYRKPAGTEGAISSSPSTPLKQDLHSTMKNVVCYVGKKGRRIVFQSRVVPRGCSEMATDLVGDAAATNGGSYNTVNTLVQNSAENAATSQISSVSFSSNDHPQSASAFGQAISNGRNSNRLVHSSSVVTNGAHGTSSRASSYALSSSKNFDTPLLITTDKQVYDEDFVVPTSISPKTRIASSWNDLHTRNPNHQVDQKYEPRDSVSSGSAGNTQLLRSSHLSSDLGHRNSSSSRNISSNANSYSRNHSNSQTPRSNSEYRKYFKHFDSWDSNV